MLCFRYRWSALTVLATLASPVGCTQFAEDGSTEEVASRSSAILAFQANQAAETVVTTPHLGGFVVTSNEDDPAFISYTDTSRSVFAGASMMGWHFFQLEEDGAAGRVRPPSGWSVLWGDPAIVRLRGVPSRVYMGSLAIPNAKMPASGIIEGSVINNTDPALCGAHIGGGCIARSLDFGTTFTLKASDCVRRTTAACPNGTFYDGMDLETSVNAARIWAAFTDVTRSSTDVYLAMFSTSSFARVTDPPRGGEVVMHPRIRLGSNGLYLVQQGSSGNLTITRYPDISRLDQAWTTPVQVAPAANFSSIQLGPDANNFIRVGPQYDLDIGLNENGAEEVRIVYAVGINGRSHIRVTRCTTGTPIVCSQPPPWRTDSSPGHQFHPSIAYGLRSDNVPIWALSFQSNQRFAGQNRVELVRAHLPSATSFHSAIQETVLNIPCPDLRGYWGDYDNMEIGTGPDGANGMTVRGTTQKLDANANCFRRQFTASPQQSVTSHWFH